MMVAVEVNIVCTLNLNYINRAKTFYSNTTLSPFIKKLNEHISINIIHFKFVSIYIDLRTVHYFMRALHFYSNDQ